MPQTPIQVERLLNRGLEVVGQGKTTLVSPNSTSSSSNTTVSFSLAYKPLVLAFVAFSSAGTYFIMPYNEIEVVTTGAVKWQVAYELNTGSITFYFRNIGTATTNTAYIRYYLLKDPAQV